MITWFVTVKDKAGTVAKYQQRGPGNAAESRTAAMRDIVLSQTKRAIDSGADDPGLEIIAIEAGPDDGGAPVGGWIPPGAAQVDLDKYKLAEEEAIRRNEAAIRRGADAPAAVQPDIKKTAAKNAE